VRPRADSEKSAAWMPAVGVGRGDADGLQVAVTGGRRPPAIHCPARRDPRRYGDRASCRLPGFVALPPTTSRRTGRVALVGGGPGADDLITVRGRRLLAQADVVVTDRLGATGLLAQLPERTKVIDVGKTPGHHPVPQFEINEILVREAKEGQLVVRLKGGDPFVLGRGGEEMLHCAAHGIPVEVVPGVTSGGLGPGRRRHPGHPRGVTASFVIASAHDGPEHVLAAARSAAPDATLVLLMGVTRLAETAAGLIAAGRAPHTPVAMIESGWTTGAADHDRQPSSAPPRRHGRRRPPRPSSSSATSSPSARRVARPRRREPVTAETAPAGQDVVLLAHGSPDPRHARRRRGAGGVAWRRHAWASEGAGGLPRPPRPDVGETARAGCRARRRVTVVVLCS
jgi:uroporphyrin-III C-methyltransferase